MKKRRSEAIYIPNQEYKNPSNKWWSSPNSEQMKQRIEEQKRREKQALKNK